MYADDLAILSTEDEVGTAQVRLQTCLDKLDGWTNDWAMKINATKTTYTIFSKAYKLPTVRLNLDGIPLQKEDNPRYLGVTFDPGLTWTKHIENVQAKGIKRTGLLKKLAGTDWGANMNVLKKTYVGYVRPVMEYGISAWGTAANTNINKVSKVQNQNLRIITGSLKSTPINDMEAITKLEPMEDRRDKKMLTQYTKFQHLKDHPMRNVMNCRPKTQKTQASILCRLSTKSGILS